MKHRVGQLVLFTEYHKSFCGETTVGIILRLPNPDDNHFYVYWFYGKEVFSYNEFVMNRYFKVLP